MKYGRKNLHFMGKKSLETKLFSHKKNTKLSTLKKLYI